MKLLKYIVVCFLITACKSQNTLVSKREIKQLSIAKIVKRHNSNSLDKKTVKARLKIKFESETEKASATAKLRIEKDKNIWISVTKTGYPFAKIHITPTRVRYYEKIHKVYFDGDFSLLNTWLGTDFTFKMVQNLLLGHALFKLNKKELTAQIVNKSYKLNPKQANRKFDILYFINPSHFHVDKEVISKENTLETLELTYTTYQELAGEIFPKQISIITNKEGKIAHIEAEYKSVDFNKKTNFPFAFPEGYKELVLKK